MTKYKKAARRKISYLTGADIPQVIYTLSKIPFILTMYEHKIDLEAHRDEMFFLYRLIDFLHELES